ncbi:MAG TPA: hypothetical protein VJ715_15655 [Pyrinomonadaceae bacterium]|nr:hypothetical protein [Pyrinomonadaceae bacterium]
MNSTLCNCETKTSRPSVNERPRYYARQLITPDDMTLEQDYFRTKLRRHNRLLHGWGVVCGARVVFQEAKPWKLIVKTGYILGPYGDEIYIEKDQCVDVRRQCASLQPEPEPHDMECTEEQQPQQPTPSDQTRYLAIRYVEQQTRLVRVPLGGCGCEESACEYSRFSDGYEICLLEECPDSHKNPPNSESLAHGVAPDCPECPTDPWVVLSAFTVNEEGQIELQECECRRQVNAFGHFWWSCTPTAQEGRATDLALRPTTELVPKEVATKTATKSAKKPATEPAKEPAKEKGAAPAGGTPPPAPVT